MGLCIVDDELKTCPLCYSNVYIDEDEYHGIRREFERLTWEDERKHHLEINTHVTRMLSQISQQNDKLRERNMELEAKTLAYEAMGYRIVKLKKMLDQVVNNSGLCPFCKASPSVHKADCEYAITMGLWMTN